MNKFVSLIAISLVLGSCMAAPHNMLRTLKQSKRAVIVDDNGFYLGDGSNNNLREASQLHDLGGPLVNPWINAYTQPIARFGPALSGAIGAAGHIAAAGAAAAVAGPVAPVAAPSYPQSTYQQPQQPQYSAPAPVQQQQYAAPVQQPQYSAPAPQYSAPVQQPQYSAPMPQQPQQQYGMQAPLATPMQSGSGSPLGSAGPDGKMSAFTAVFVPGEPTMFRVGVPTDFPNGYTAL